MQANKYALVMPVKPGQEIEPSIMMTAPSKPGNYLAFFRMGVPDGKEEWLFGDKMNVDIVVEEEAAPRHVDMPRPAEPHKFAQQLAELNGMGFSDNRVNLHVLEKANGDVNQAMNMLLDQNVSSSFFK